IFGDTRAALVRSGEAERPLHPPPTCGTLTRNTGRQIMADRPVYEIVSPAGEEPAAGKYAPAKPLDTFENKKIGLIWCVFTNGDLFLEPSETLLGKRSPSLSYVKMPPGRNAEWGGYPDRPLPDYVREMGLDAAIITAGC